MQSPLRLLILGGTTEARQLSERLAGRTDITPILSLAGRTSKPLLPSIAYRIGGFGGIAGLNSYLMAEQIDLVIDATHPFAEQMSAHADAACRASGVPLVFFTRPPWVPQAGDRWRHVETAAAAAQALGTHRRRVFLTVGRLQLPAFEAAPQHYYLIRSIDPPQPAVRLPDHRLVLARGPYIREDEIALMRAEKIDVLVSKNSGGEATFAKMEAARELGIEVILMQPPARADVESFYELDVILRFLDKLAHQKAPAARGV